jgi:hypothetical protein
MGLGIGRSRGMGIIVSAGVPETALS